MCRLSSFFAMVALFGLMFGGVAQAHVLREDRGISGVLHMPPSDEPKAGEQTNLYVSFGDKADKFSLANCNCTLTVAKDGKQLAKLTPQPQIKGATLASISTYEFPSIGAYDIAVAGTAKNGSFPSFKLTYVVRVASDVRSAATLERNNINSEIYIISGGVLAAIVIFAYAGMRDGKRYAAKPVSKSVSK